MTIDELIKLAEQHDQKATKGPRVKKFRESDGLWLIKFPHIPRGFHGDCSGYLIYADEADVDFDCASRAAWPQTARALKVAIAQRNEVLSMVLDSKYAGAFRKKWDAEIDRIAKGAGE